MVNVITRIRLEVAPLVTERHIFPLISFAVSIEHAITVTLATETDGSAVPIHPWPSSIHRTFSQHEVGDTLTPCLCQFVPVNVISMRVGRYTWQHMTRVLTELHCMIDRPANLSSYVPVSWRYFWQ